MRARSLATLAFMAASSFYSLPAKCEMYVCRGSDGSPVLRNMACSAQERTVSINGLSPQEWERRTAEKSVAEANARTLEEAARQADENRRAASQSQGSTFAEAARNMATTGGIGAAIRAVVDPSGAARDIMEKNKPRGR
jgi:hypothetical protein